MFGIHQTIYDRLTSRITNKINIVTENLKNLKILPLYRKYTIT